MAAWLGLDLEHHDGETVHVVGGATVIARCKTVSVRLLAPADRTDQSLEWEAPVGFISGWRTSSLVLPGSVGFLDRWTVTVSRFAQAIAVEDRIAFDARFGVVLPIWRALPTPFRPAWPVRTQRGPVLQPLCVAEAAPFKRWKEPPDLPRRPQGDSRRRPRRARAPARAD